MYQYQQTWINIDKVVITIFTIKVHLHKPSLGGSIPIQRVWEKSTVYCT